MRSRCLRCRRMLLLAVATTLAVPQGLAKAGNHIRRVGIAIPDLLRARASVVD